MISGLLEAFRLIATADIAVAEIVLVSIWVSGSALLISTVIGIPAGAWMGLSRFRGQGLATALIYTGMGLPPVVVGLLIYVLLSRNGPLGDVQLSFIPTLFTPEAMIAAQTVIALPLVTGFTMSAVSSVDPELRRQIRALGATSQQVTFTVLREARAGVVVAVAAGFGRVIAEVGAVMLVGGNIDGQTRVLTTAIVLETRKGNFDLAIALGIVLLSLAFISNAILLRLQGNARIRV